MIAKVTCFALFIFSVFLIDSTNANRIDCKDYFYFENNPDFDRQTKEKLQPYLLPLDHPAKAVLDSIFSHGNPLKNKKSFKKAGFTIISKNTSSLAYIAKHARLPGYLVKAYLQTRPKGRMGNESWMGFLMRCQGADNIRKLISSHHLRYFSVPDKWIYPLPKRAPFPPREVILVVTDSQLTPRSECQKAWKNASKACLDELYIILAHGYASTFLVGNIPYTKSGTFACVDTEFPIRKHKMERVIKYLSSEMGTYWSKLTKCTE